MKITFEYYHESFYGEVIPEDSFQKWIKRAETKLNYLTFGKAECTTDTGECQQIPDSLCALAECMYMVESERKKAENTTSDKNIKSMSSGGESISYEVQKTIYQDVLHDKAAEDRLYRDTVAEYLQGTGLLYAGV